MTTKGLHVPGPSVAVIHASGKSPNNASKVAGVRVNTDRHSSTKSGSMAGQFCSKYPRALLLRPGRNHAVAARVRDRLPQMLVLIFEKQHQRALLCHVSSEQFHRRL